MTRRVMLLGIRIDGGTQPRAAISEDIVTEYADALHAGIELPPVDLFFDGVEHWLADGFHRYHAAQRLGLEDIPATVHAGLRRDAVLFSCGANVGHGLRRTNEDKRKAVMTLLDDDEWRGWSDREISRRCSVDNSFVGDMRRRRESSLLVTNSEDITRKHTNKHGTVATMKTENIGRRAEKSSGHESRRSAAMEGCEDNMAVRRLPRKHDADIINSSMQSMRGMVGALATVDASAFVDDPRAPQWRETTYELISTLRSFTRQLERKRTA